MSDRHDAELAVASLRMAAAVRGGSVSGVIFHTDQGSEYTSGLFTGACRSLGVVQSMGRVGSALDNAAAESFFSTLEHELLPPPVRHPGRSPAGRRRMDRPLLQPDQAALHHRGAVTHDYELAATTAAAAA
jgi:transposase InsO family protein